jgi:hypothetical protein
MAASNGGSEPGTPASAAGGGHGEHVKFPLDRVGGRAARCSPTKQQSRPHTMGNLKKKRRLQMNKHKRRKRLKANRHKKRTWQK